MRWKNATMKATVSRPALVQRRRSKRKECGTGADMGARIVARKSVIPAKAGSHPIRIELKMDPGCAAMTENKMETLKTMTYAATGRIARITLNRPERGNGITLDLPRELAACVERADLDPAVHVIALAGNGKGFCGGYDLVQSAQ